MRSSTHVTMQRVRYTPVAWLLIASCLLAFPVAAAPIDEFRISDMEQRIRDLEATTREQARLIAQLQSQSGSGHSAAAPTVTSRVPASSEPRWLNAANWTRIKPGMNELQVIEVLGAPTQIRVSSDGHSRSLLYAMEIGRSGFLSGKVDMQGTKATNIELPQLK